MHVEERLWSSPSLGHDMALKVYGHAGRPVVAFPSQDGRYWDFESWGMVEACAGFIDAGRMRLVAVDGIDWQSWTNHSISPADRGRRHDAYDRYIADEVVPFARDLTGWERAWATGASMGAYHAANAVFRHPDRFDGLIALSGLYSLRIFVGDDGSEPVYFNSPLSYLPNLEDPWYLERLREARLAFVVGRGAWEDDMLADTRAMRAVLEAKAIPAIVDEWGDDVNHDWPWWRRMLPHYLEVLGV
ncbi:MAG: transposase [Chloroflexi bacterium]|nr:transposase [Chloroflexota bacterium]